MDHIREYFDDLAADGYCLMDIETLHRRLSESDRPQIVDIRKNADYQSSRIPGSRHVEWEDVGSFIESGTLPHDRDIVVVCYVGQSSGQITGILRSLGYRAYSLLDGYLEWEAKGLPTESDTG